MYKIFIIEDDPVIAQAVASHLTMWGYQVQTVSDFTKTAEEFTACAPHLVLLDIGLPCMNGYHWCREIRRRSKTPVIFLSSAADNLNIVTAIELGGDDFVAKPFDLSVLTAKIQALLRRTYSLQSSVDVIEHRGALLNLGDEVLTGPQGRQELTKNEFRILKVLMENAGHTVSREDLMVRLWESESFIDDNTLTVNVSRLRKKLEQAGLKGLLATRKGQGYILE